MSCDGIKQDYIIKKVLCPHIFDAANIVYLYESTDGFLDESLYTVPIKRHALIYNPCQLFCLRSFLPLSFVAAIWWHHCELKMNLHQMQLHYDTVECSRSNHREKLYSCVAYRMRFGTRCVVLCKSCDVERVQDAGSVFVTGGGQNG